MNAKDAMIDDMIQVALQRDVIERQAALIREYEEYVTLLKQVLREHGYSIPLQK